MISRQNSIFALVEAGSRPISVVDFPDTPSQRVQFILGTEEDEEHVPHELFTELDEISMKEGEDAEWKETARCVPKVNWVRICLGRQWYLSARDRPALSFISSREK